MASTKALESAGKQVPALNRVHKRVATQDALVANTQERIWQILGQALLDTAAVVAHLRFQFQTVAPRAPVPHHAPAMTVAGFSDTVLDLTLSTDSDQYAANDVLAATQALASAARVAG